jgi:DnaJ-class molecular chaperone
MTLYEILQVTEKAEKEVIATAYKGLVKKYHPDVSKSPDAERD